MSAPSGDEPGPGEEEENDLLGLLDDELQQLADSNSDDDESSNDDVDAASNNDFPGVDEVEELNGHQEVEDSWCVRTYSMPFMWWRHCPESSVWCMYTFYRTPQLRTQRQCPESTNMS
jgi:hypothetical protein